MNELELKEPDLKNTKKHHCLEIFNYMMSDSQENLRIVTTNYGVNGIVAVIEDYDGEEYEVTISPRK